jgi:hypothetical protein
MVATIKLTSKKDTAIAWSGLWGLTNCILLTNNGEEEQWKNCSFVKTNGNGVV